jgi:filamentous hemagglutinin
VSAGLSAPTASGAGIAAPTLSPAASYEIGQYFNGKDAEGSAAHILAHTILGAAVAATGGNNALSAGIAAGGSEAAAPLLSQYLYGKKAKDLTSSQKNYSSSS